MVTAKNTPVASHTQALPKTIYPTLSTGKLDLQGIDIDCAVIQGSDKKPIRVLSRKRFQICIGIADHKSIGNDSENGLPYFLATQNLKPYSQNDLQGLLTPLWYKEPHRGLVAAGYRADLLPAVCSIYLQAHFAGVLTPAQEPIAARCMLIQNAFARLGILALVDEATGYQETRERDELQKLIKLYLGEVPLPWMTTFPREFYAEAYRLHHLAYTPGNTSHPSIIGAFTKRAIYEWLPPGVYEELCARNPRVHGENTSWRIRKHHQHLTPEIGRQQVLGQLRIVLHCMRASGSLDRFWLLLESGRPSPQIVLPFYLADDTFLIKGA